MSSSLRLLDGAIAEPLPRFGRGDADALIAAVRAAGLTGRGGAGFPTADKLAAIAGRRRPVVIANGSESEPMSSKDRLLLAHAPQLVFDGATIVAQILGAREALIAVRDQTLADVQRAIADRGSSGVRLRAVATKPGYVSGEETALIAHLQGGQSRPRVKPPMAFESGLNRRPTIVQNVETLAHLAVIARHGRDTGTRLVTVSGAVRAPGVYEVATWAPLQSIVAMAGGEDVRATLVGGYFGGWHDGDGGDRTVTGAGVVAVLGRSSCGVMEVARVARWMAAQGAGQCGPCINGLESLAGLLERLAGRRFEHGDGERLTRWLEMVRGRGACKHPDGVAAMIASATRVMHAEFNAHARGEPCARCAAPAVLATPTSTGEAVVA